MLYFRGTKKNMMEYTESPSYLKNINEVIKPSGAIITAKDVRKPIYNYKEFDEIKLDVFLNENFSKELGTKNLHWWLKNLGPNPKTPYWDLLSTCKINGKKGILLLQSKSHTGDLTYISIPRGQSVNASVNAIENSKHIEKALEEAKNGVAKTEKGVNISTKKCYQISSRIAMAWWLANNGIPTVLLFGGMLNKTGPFYNKKRIFKTEEEFHELFTKKASKIGAEKLYDKWVNCGNESFYTMCKSM